MSAATGWINLDFSTIASQNWLGDSGELTRFEIYGPLTSLELPKDIAWQLFDLQSASTVPGCLRLLWRVPVYFPWRFRRQAAYSLGAWRGRSWCWPFVLLRWPDRLVRRMILRAPLHRLSSMPIPEVLFQCGQLVGYLSGLDDIDGEGDQAL